MDWPKLKRRNRQVIKWWGIDDWSIGSGPSIPKEILLAAGISCAFGLDEETTPEKSEEKKGT